MRSMLLQLALCVALCGLMCGCERPDGPEPPLPDPNSPERQKEGEAYLKKQKEESEQKMKAMGQMDVLRRLGPIAEWQISDVKNGKVDDAIVKAKKDGTYDAVMKRAFTNRGLQLKFFSHMPYAMRGLHAADPSPETCDFICEIPAKWQPEIQSMVEPESKTSDTDPSGKPRDWYRLKDISLGVVEGSVTVVRAHLDSKVKDWEWATKN